MLCNKCSLLLNSAYAAYKLYADILSKKSLEDADVSHGGVAQWLDVSVWPVDFPSPVHDLWFTADHYVSELSAMGQPTRPTQPSIPLVSVNR